MKRISLITISFVLTLSCFGQTMFFDSLNNSTWLSVSNVTDSVMKTAKQISLRKLNYSQHSLNESATIWNFENGLLTTHSFDYKKKSNTVITTCNYAVNPTKNILTIYLDDKELKFSVGLTSTGNNAILIREKEKRKSTGT